MLYDLKKYLMCSYYLWGGINNNNSNAYGWNIIGELQTIILIIFDFLVDGNWSSFKYLGM
jgi:hypothetical protein